MTTTLTWAAGNGGTGISICSALETISGWFLYRMWAWAASRIFFMFAFSAAVNGGWTNAGAASANDVTAVDDASADAGWAGEDAVIETDDVVVVRGVVDLLFFGSW